MRVIDPDQGGEVDFQELKDIIENGPAAGSATPAKAKATAGDSRAKAARALAVAAAL